VVSHNVCSNYYGTLFSRLMVSRLTSLFSLRVYRFGAGKSERCAWEVGWANAPLRFPLPHRRDRVDQPTLKNQLHVRGS
jgi:hypothetical protein